MNALQGLYENIREKLPSVQCVAKVSAITLVVAAYALTAFTSIAFVFSGMISAPLSLIGIVSLMVTLANFSLVPDLITQHNMTRETLNYREDIRNFIRAAMPDLVSSIAITMSLISLTTLLNNIFPRHINFLNPR